MYKKPNFATGFEAAYSTLYDITSHLWPSVNKATTLHQMWPSAGKGGCDRDNSFTEHSISKSDHWALTERAFFMNAIQSDLYHSRIFPVDGHILCSVVDLFTLVNMRKYHFFIAYASILDICLFCCIVLTRKLQPLGAALLFSNTLQFIWN